MHGVIYVVTGRWWYVGLAWAARGTLRLLCVPRLCGTRPTDTRCLSTSPPADPLLLILSLAGC